MTGAMYAAIAGMKTHMNKLNVIGNNVANVNTYGYKTQRTVFRDALYTMYSSGSDGTATAGGKNPSQVGYGSSIASIDLNMTSSTYTPGRPMDCMLYGDGFFLVGGKDAANVIDPMDPNSFKSLTLTRVGDFEFKADGYLTDGKGNPVYGFMTVGVDAEGNPIVSDQLVPIRLPRMEKLAVDPNTGDPLNGPVTDDMVEGKDYKWSYTVRYPVVKKEDNKPLTDANNLLDGDVGSTRLEDYWPVNDDGDKVGDTNPLAFAQIDGLEIDPKSGKISGTLKDTDQVITIGYLAVGNVTNPNGVSHTGDSYYKCGSGAGDLQISMLGGAADTIKTVNGGKLTHVNGSLAPKDAVLSKKSEITSAGSTELITGGLEASNVDLATEISDMITTQRGYQANTRIITVTDTMLEELVNMKR
ncbi:flagellar hook-basal body complex protein [Intestinimonas sp.]|uniref:flagellar hook-basal body complex protein n=1 Tax=Intestinimonas sp. TaxID=1965293 RepID=UPI00261A28F5|nr:flagellar hook-basal body complex protein [Intestinimonas sp.]